MLKGDYSSGWFVVKEVLGLLSMSLMDVLSVGWLCFFFQAEDGIRDYKVTGVQTCALPIFGWTRGCRLQTRPARAGRRVSCASDGFAGRLVSGTAGGDRAADDGKQRRAARSGERRGGEEGRSRGGPDHLKKKKKAAKSSTHA